MTSSGSYNVAMEALASKARRALFRMREILYSNNIQSCSTYISMFDLLVRPILTYASEIWAVNNHRKRDGFSMDLECDRSPFEKINLRFCKQLLGVHSKASNMAVRGELGRYPIMCTIVISMVKYFVRLRSLPEERTLKRIIIEIENGNIASSWWTTVSSILDNLGIDININMNDSQKVKLLLKEATDAVYCFYQDHYFNVLHDENQTKKLRTYRLFKDTYSYEPYLDILHNPVLRKNYTRFRISAHRLEIEVGRWKHVNLENRVCTSCINSVENETHFMFVCPKYVNERQELYRSTNNCNLFSSTSCNNEKLVTLMSSSVPEIVKATAKYISISFNIHQQQS